MNDHQELIEIYLDGELTTEQEKRLADWLAADREHMRRFVREVHLHRQLRDIMLAQSFQVKAGPVAGKVKQPDALSLIAAAALAFRRIWLPFAVCLVLALGFGVWYFNPAVGEPALADIQGSGLILERAGRRLPATVGIHLQPGDVLRTPDNVSAIIGYEPEPTQLKLLPGTELRLAATARGKLFALVVGKLEATVARQTPFRPMILKTPQAEARVIGTRFALSVRSNATRLDVIEGLVRFTRASDEQFVRVGAGHFAVAAADYELSALPLAGSILREYWTNVPGSFHTVYLTSNTNYPDHPSGRDYLSKLETPSNSVTNYGERIRGYLLPPATGDYTFWIKAGDGGDLYLSPDDNPDHRQQIAHWEGPKRNSQQSAPVPLQAGGEYYIEVLQKTGNADSHLAVEWQIPGRNREIISGEFLSPWKLK
jgi:hypothetical protein